MDYNQMLAEMLQNPPDRAAAQEAALRAQQMQQKMGGRQWGGLFGAVEGAIKNRPSKREEYSNALMEALSQQQGLDQYDSTLGTAQDLFMRGQEAEIDESTKAKYREPKDSRTPEQKNMEAYIQLIQDPNTPDEVKRNAQYWLGMDERQQPNYGTANIGGNVVPTVDGRPQMDQPLGKTETTLTQEAKQAEKEKEKDYGSRQLVEKMRGFSELITAPNFGSTVGPLDSSWASKAMGGLFNTKDYQLHRKAEQLGGQEVLRLGAEVLKGSQTEGEWERVSRALPSTKDHPEVWRNWYDTALKTIMAGRPDLAGELDPLRKTVLGEQYTPYQPPGSDDLSVDEIIAQVKARNNR